jgi:tetratricopeptide (TPR) repeat protein
VILLFALPFVTQPLGQDPLLPKLSMTQALVFLMAGFWALKVHSTGRLDWVHSKALLALAFLSLWLLGSLAFSPYAAASSLALRDLWPFLLWYLLLTLTCREAWRGENLLVVFLVSGLGTALWGLAQALGWGEGHWMRVVGEIFGGRPVAGLGSPERLAGFLLLIWPMALALWVRSTHPLGGIFWGGTVLLSLAAIHLTGSRSAWAAVAVGAAVFGLVLLRGGKKGLRVWPIGIALFLAALFLVPASLEKFRTLGGENAGQVLCRAQVLEGTWDHIRGNLVGGTGYGSYWAAFPSSEPLSLRMDPAMGNRPIRHADNWVLEWMADTGVIGLVLLLAFLWAVVLPWWRLFKAHAIPPSLAAGFFAVLAGVGVDNLFQANNYQPPVLAGLLFLAALPVALSGRFIPIPGFPIQEKVIDLSAYRAYLLPVLVLAGTGCLWQVKVAFERQGADVLLGKAQRSAREGKIEEALRSYDASMRQDPLNLLTRYFRGVVSLATGKPEDAEKALVDLTALDMAAPGYGRVRWYKYQAYVLLDRRVDAAAELRKAIALFPLGITGLEDYKKAQDLMKKGKAKEALAVYGGLVQEHPSCPPLMVGHAKSLAAVGRVSDARRVLGDALKLVPGYEDAARELSLLGK